MMNQPQWPKISGLAKSAQGFLLDREIADALNQGQLITGGNSNQAKYACYEVRIGSDIRQLVLDQVPGTENALYRVKRIGEDNSFQINPGETFKIYALEKLHMPSDVFAIAIPVGNMYKLGLNPETTFADPGFAREFFVTVCNYSPRVVKLKVGDPLARIFFFKLSDRPTRIHEGEPREIPPSVERVRRPDLNDMKRMGQNALIDDVLRTVDPPHYQHAFVTSQVLALRRNSAVTTLVTLATFFIMLSIAVVYFGQFLKGIWPSFFENLLAEFLGAIVVGLIVVFAIPPLRKTLIQSLRDVAS